MTQKLFRQTVLCFALGHLMFGPSILSAAADQPKSKVLKGGVNKDGEKANAGLQRTDISTPGVNGADPFSGDEKVDEIDAPTKDQMQMEAPRQPPSQAPLNGMVNDQGRGNMQSMLPKGNPFGGDEEPMPNFQQEPEKQGSVQQNDPDNNPDMQLLWDQWHHRVAESIYKRFNILAKFAFKYSPPLMCQISYVVTNDGHINNVQMQQKSTNVLFNMIVSQTVKSLDGDVNLLQFPPGSRRFFVPKVGTFTQNYGNDGFKFTTGDKETIQNRQGR